MEIGKGRVARGMARVARGMVARMVANRRVRHGR